MKRIAIVILSVLMCTITSAQNNNIEGRKSTLLAKMALYGCDSDEAIQYFWDTYNILNDDCFDFNNTYTVTNFKNTLPSSYQPQYSRDFYLSLCDEIKEWRSILLTVQSRYGEEYLSDFKTFYTKTKYQWYEERCSEYAKKESLYFGRDENYWASKLDSLDFISETYLYESKLRAMAGDFVGYRDAFLTLILSLEQLNNHDLLALANIEVLEAMKFAKNYGPTGTCFLASGNSDIFQVFKEYGEDTDRWIEEFQNRLAQAAYKISFPEISEEICLSYIDNFYKDGSGYSVNTLIQRLLLMSYLCFDEHKLTLYNDRDKAIHYANLAKEIIEQDTRLKDQMPVFPVYKSETYYRLFELQPNKSDSKALKYLQQSIDIDTDYDVFIPKHEVGYALAIATNKDNLKTSLDILQNINSLGLRSYEDKLYLKQNEINFALITDNHEILESSWSELQNLIMNEYYRYAFYLPETFRSSILEQNGEINNLARGLGFGRSYLKDDSISGSLYDALLFQKGLLLQQSNRISYNIKHSDDDSLKLAYNLYLDAKRNNRDLKDQYICERNLMWIYTSHPGFNNLSSPSWQEVQNKLGPKDIAIEFIKHVSYGKSNMYTGENVEVYAAVLLTKQSKSPEYIELCNSDELERLLNNKDANDFPKILRSTEQSAIYNLVWGKLEKKLKGADKIYFSPDGILCQTNIECLKKDNEGKSIGEIFSLRRVSSTANISDGLSDSITIKSASIFGGLDYDLNSNSSDPANTSSISSSLAKNGETRGKNWGYLENTKKEGRFLLEEFTKQKFTVQLFDGSKGTETSFKKLSGNEDVNLIHLATHGFYFSQELAAKIPFFYGAESPMKRSGLLFAGANQTWQGTSTSTDGDDQILLASEIAGMELSSVDLLFLSACQTGLGDSGIDGVYGLQRGFKLAGVKTIVMSLWSVDDKATMEFVSDFYAALLENGDKYMAYRTAVEKTREKYPDDPYYWASFIMLD